MSRKSSWWLRPQRKGASNRAALNEANYFMEHNKVLRERINELAAENAKLRGMCADMYAAIDMADYVHDFDDPMHLMFIDDMRELGIEVDG